MLDVRAEAKENADFTLGVPEIGRREAEFGPIPRNSAVILRTGFEDRWDDPPAYLNADAAGRMHYPGFGAEAASWLIERRSVGALGIDTMGIDPGADTSFGVNRLLLRDHRIHLENLAGLGEMPPRGGWIIVGVCGYGAAPVRRRRCSGWSPSRLKLSLNVTERLHKEKMPR